MKVWKEFPHRRPVEQPEQIGDYRILREIGRGGMGSVYEAEQMLLGRHVALKLLRNRVFSDRTVRERFRREARSRGTAAPYQYRPGLRGWA